MWWAFAYLVYRVGEFMWKSSQRAQDIEAQIEADAIAEAAAAEALAAATEAAELQAEIDRLAIEKTEAETKFEVEAIERQMKEVLATGRARRGVSGLTAEGSPIMVRIYIGEQYEKMAAYRKQMGEVGADILGLQAKIGEIEAQLKISGIEYDIELFDIYREQRSREQRAQTFGSLLDIGGQFLSFGYGMKRTQIPGYQPPFESPEIGYGGFK